MFSGVISVNLSRILIVGAGSLLGGMLRYIISVVTAKYFGDFPLGTLLVNVAGGFLIGFIMQAGINLWSLSTESRIFITTGFLGGLTTFSTFSYETISLLAEGSYFMGALNVCLNLFLALSACWGGAAVARML